MKTRLVFGALLSAACLACPLPAGADGDDSFEVDFDNQASFSVTVYLNGNVACNLNAGASCSPNLSGSNGNYSVHFVASTGSTSDDTVGPDTCEALDVPTFTIYDDHVHFGCEPIL